MQNNFSVLRVELSPCVLSMQVQITVRDINDNPPMFTKDVYEVSLSEDSPAGTTVITVTAHDRDTPEVTRLTYTLQNTNAQCKYFVRIKCSSQPLPIDSILCDNTF